MKKVFSKKIQSGLFYKHLMDVKKECCIHHMEKEQSYSNYSKKLKEKGIYLSSYDRKVFSNNQSKKQKSNSIVEYSIKNDLKPIFLTITLPSFYHPFIGRVNKKGIYTYYRENDKFNFNSIDESIINGYDNLKKFFRLFYKNIKRETKNILYISCIEPHTTSLIPHMHILLFINSDMIEVVKKIFNRNIKHYKLGRSDFLILDSKKDGNDIKLTSSYVNKYMFKNLYTSDNTSVRLINGYYKKYKIRSHRMSNMPLSLEVYKKVYYNLDSEYKKDLINSFKKSKSLFSYIQENIYIEKNYFNELGEEVFKRTKNSIVNSDIDKEFYVSISIQEYKRRNKLKPSYKITKFKVIHRINNKEHIIYEKGDYKSNLIDEKHFFNIELFQ